MTVLRLGVLPWRVRPVPGVAAWAARLDGELAAAAAQGVQLAVLPEYAPLEAACQGEANLADELRAALAMTPALLREATAAASRHGVWLATGTMPHRQGDEVRNRCALIAPGGGLAFQDKRVMTRFEAELWGVAPGAPPAVFETPWGRIGIAICYDLEFPPLVRAQVEAGAWLILSPSCTDTLAGFNRVRVAARARAMENQCYVAVAPTTGEAPQLAVLDTNRGCGGIYGPIDRAFPDDGVLAEGPMDESDWVIADLDPARLDLVRADGAVRNHRDYPPAPPPCRVERPA